MKFRMIKTSNPTFGKQKTETIYMTLSELKKLYMESRITVDHKNRTFYWLDGGQMLQVWEFAPLPSMKDRQGSQIYEGSKVRIGGGKIHWEVLAIRVGHARRNKFTRACILRSPGGMTAKYFESEAARSLTVVEQPEEIEQEEQQALRNCSECGSQPEVRTINPGEKYEAHLIECVHCMAAKKYDKQVIRWTLDFFNLANAKIEARKIWNAKNPTHTEVTSKKAEKALTAMADACKAMILAEQAMTGLFEEEIMEKMTAKRDDFLSYYSDHAVMLQIWKEMN